MEKEIQNKSNTKTLTGLAIGTGLAIIYAVVTSSKKPETTAEITINSPIDKVFEYVLPINLTHIFTGNMLIPAITNTSIKEDWGYEGMVRTITFKDKSTFRENLLSVSGPNSFSYKIDRLTSPLLKNLVESLDGNWKFTDLGSNQTKIEVTYMVKPNNLVTRPIVDKVLMSVVNSMLFDALKIIKYDMENGQLTGSKF